MDRISGDQHRNKEDPLAYGDDYEDPPEGYPDEEGYPEDADGERGIIGDTYRKLRGKPPKKPGQSSGVGSFIFNKLHDAVQDIGSELGKRIDGKNQHSHTHAGAQCDDGMHTNNSHRYGSFADQRYGNDAKWYVDACGYMWAVSRALEQARESIWILDCMSLRPPV